MQNLSSAEKAVLDENLDMLHCPQRLQLISTGTLVPSHDVLNILMGSPRSDTTEVYLTMII